MRCGGLQRRNRQDERTVFLLCALISNALGKNEMLKLRKPSSILMNGVALCVALFGIKPIAAQTKKPLSFEAISKDGRHGRFSYFLPSGYIHDFSFYECVLLDVDRRERTGELTLSRAPHSMESVLVKKIFSHEHLKLMERGVNRYDLIVPLTPVRNIRKRGLDVMVYKKQEGLPPLVSTAQISPRSIQAVIERCDDGSFSFSTQQ